jgi:4-oxalocrotonate tautomerase
MPYVNIKVTDDGVTPHQKAALVRDVTDSLVRVLGKKPEHIHVVIDLVHPENWGYDGVLTTEYRERAKS